MTCDEKNARSRSPACMEFQPRESRLEPTSAFWSIFSLAVSI